MKYLLDYLDNTNTFRKMFGRTALDINNSEDLRYLAQKLEGDLSPENLTMDGELPAAEVNKRHRYLIAVARDIKQMDPSIRFWEIDHV